jgi:REP element-mobilizing transposase RayT
MPNTYTQMYVHVIFAVKRRESLITPKLRENLYAYITGITKKKDQKLISINGMPDHIHLLIGFKPDCNLSELIRDIKANSSKWINQNDFLKNKFEWQSGFGAFTIGHSKIATVANYITNQENHHHKKTFREEYIDFLNAYKIQFKPEYIFEEVDVTPPEFK